MFMTSYMFERNFPFLLFWMPLLWCAGSKNFVPIRKLHLQLYGTELLQDINWAPHRSCLELYSILVCYHWLYMRSGSPHQLYLFLYDSFCCPFHQFNSSWFLSGFLMFLLETYQRYLIVKLKTAIRKHRRFWTAYQEDWAFESFKLGWR